MPGQATPRERVVPPDGAGEPIRGEYLPPGTSRPPFTSGYPFGADYTTSTAGGAPSGPPGPATGVPQPGGPAPRPTGARRALTPLIVLVIAAVVLEALLRKHELHAYELIMLLVLVPSVVLHEVSHGAVAYVCGDDTAKRAGRLTLNPVRHIDPFGSVILPAILVLTGIGAFGWAKPVPVNVGKMRHPRNQAVLVGLVGPAVNITLACLMAVLFRHFTLPHGTFAVSPSTGLPSSLGLEILFLAGYINVILAAFNLIPIPPLDGSAVVERLLPRSVLPTYYRFRTAMIFAVFALVLLAPGALDTVFRHALDLWGRLIS